MRRHYALFVAYRRHHTSARIKADLMLRYYGSPIGEVVDLYTRELGFDHSIARGQVKAQELMQGYFTCYYYGLKKYPSLSGSLPLTKKILPRLLFRRAR